MRKLVFKKPMVNIKFLKIHVKDSFINLSEFDGQYQFRYISTLNSDFQCFFHVKKGDDFSFFFLFIESFWSMKLAIGTFR